VTADQRILYPLKRFQKERADAIAEVFTDTAFKIAKASAKRRTIALAQGVILFRAPTGSGKTLTMGRALEGLVGQLPAKTVWFWFAPFSGLVSQTEEALSAQCPALRIRDLKSDRVAELCQDGDVFISTWSMVATDKKENRIVRQDGEEMPSIDTLIGWFRASGWHVGVVVDEAHVNFGTSAKQAAAFYLHTLQPDFTLLATATPKDAALDSFREQAGMGKVNRIEVSRHEAVDAGLNKVGVKAVYFRASQKDEALLDMDEVALEAGMRRHTAIKDALTALGVSLTPLLLVQVEDTKRGADDPVERTKAFLIAQGISPQAIAVHTSGQPDPFFHTLAYDETKEVLIFKVAVATGFDAPRAWTLVSLRPTQGAEFGQQIIGRIMRVHPRVQRWHAAHPLLDYGYVFLSNPEQQVGLREAAGLLKALADSIETVTDNVVVFEASSGIEAVLTPERGFIDLLEVEDKGQSYEFAGATPPAHGVGVYSDPNRLRAAALSVQGALDSWNGGEWHLTVPPGRESRASSEEWQKKRKDAWIAYRLRDDIDFPKALCREVMPADMDGLVQCIGSRIDFGDAVVNLVMRTAGKVMVTEADVFGNDVERHEEKFALSNSKISQQAQMAFRFNDSIDERELKPALLERLRREIDKRDWAMPGDSDLRRAIDLVGMTMPHLLHSACRECMATAVEVRQDEPIPEIYYGPPGLEPALRSLFKVFPHDLNREERAFAEMLDTDDTGTVIWWLRNLENARWAVTIVLPNGKRHFPDFVIGVDGRKTQDHIALVETKDDGETGRLFSKANTDKVRSDHSRYGSALMVYRDGEKNWTRVEYRPDIKTHVPAGTFSVRELVWSK
jgi:superfamily II DNA or RNA helicase